MRWKGSGAALVATLVVAACSEPTTSVRRFPVLDDIGSSDWASVTVGGDHTCAIKTDGSAYCWGSNQYGQLGVSHTDTTCGSLNARFSCATIPQLVQAGLQFASISAGQRHTCAITRTREAYCWGSNETGQVSDFGNGGPALTKVTSSLPWTQITAGFSHTCAVRSDGVARLLGVERPRPTRQRQFVAGNDPHAHYGAGRGGERGTVADVRAHDRRRRVLLGRRLDGTQLGTRALANSDDAAARSRRAGAGVADRGLFHHVRRGCLRIRLLLGSKSTRRDGQRERRTGASSRFAWQATSRSCSSAPESSRRAASTSRGAGYCWGDDSFGQLGALPSLLVERCGGQVLPCATKPVGVIGRQKFMEISTGFGSHTCGVTTRGNLYCWGLGQSGQRGDGTEASAVATPALVVEPSRLAGSSQSARGVAWCRASREFNARAPRADTEIKLLVATLASDRTATIAPPPLSPPRVTPLPPIDELRSSVPSARASRVHHRAVPRLRRARVGGQRRDRPRRHVSRSSLARSSRFPETIAAEERVRVLTALDSFRQPLHVPDVSASEHDVVGERGS